MSGYLLESKITLPELMNAAADLWLNVGFGRSVTPDVAWVAPGEEVEIWDRLREPEVNPIPFIVAEYAGHEPKCVRDGRRYRKTFDNPVNTGPMALTFCSSYYCFEVDSAVLEAKRVGQDNTLASAAFRILICDKDNRMRLPAYRQEPLPQRAYENEEPFPDELDEVEWKLDQ